MDWFKGKFTGKPHDLNGKIDGFRFQFSLKPIQSPSPSPSSPSQVNALRQDFLTTNPAPAKLSRAEKAARNVSAAGKKAREITQALEDAIKAEDEAVPRMGWWWNDGEMMGFDDGSLKKSLKKWEEI